MTSQITPPAPDQPVRAIGKTHNRARAARLARRAAQFNKFRLIQLNLVPLVDTFVSVVFFTLVTATVGELSPVVAGVNLPDSRVGQPALQQLTLGIGPGVSNWYSQLSGTACAPHCALNLYVPSFGVERPMSNTGAPSECAY